MNLKSVLMVFIYSIGTVSADLYARNFYYMLTETGIILIEPNVYIASIEFIIAIIGCIGLFLMAINTGVKNEHSQVYNRA